MEVREPSARYLRAVRRTELGEFPADWKIVPLGTFEPFITSGSRGWAAYYSDIGATFLRITNLSRSRIYPSLEDLRYVAVPPDNSEGIRTALKSGDVLISITADIGIIGLVTDEVDLPAYINQHIALVRFADEEVESRYVAYFLAGAAAQRRFKSMTDAGAKAGMSLTGVREVLAAIPPTKAEQGAIADALADADALIDSLEQLLTKKRQIKQGAIGELLTGKRRLPGFDGEWEMKRLGEMAGLMKGSGLSKDATTASGRRKCVLYGELFTTYGQVIHDVVGRTNSSDGLVSISGDVLVPGSTTTDGIDLATASALLESGVALGGDINIIRPKADAFDSCFLANYLTHAKKREIAERAQGTTIVHLYGRDLSDLWLHQPSLVEQGAIAQVLSDMEAEIATIEARLTKARAIKQAMAQALLTGHIRLMEST
ncbi:restriction endonuclease subunit S [Rhodoferax sp. TS-BS-61-7]|uniref:restriction endonuclease subunit S n=1 Tax=Rhodoferax sp. TS-BS-61-7 TaxID=2094194 RepID=UPI000CF6BC23|nr:restriction endonuclease subunit S [Rhodoferax sp. TS-BS-61-7]PQA78924.1 restriction endonuclease subunit S [Rhodoferax sp. TS-BS-61-7]